MRIKQFLKFDWRKFLIFSLLMISTKISSTVMILAKDPKVSKIFSAITKIIGLPLYAFGECVSSFPLLIIKFILLVLYWYLLSSFLILAYKKLKRK